MFFIEFSVYFEFVLFLLIVFIST